MNATPDSFSKLIARTFFGVFALGLWTVTFAQDVPIVQPGARAMPRVT